MSFGFGLGFTKVVKAGGGAAPAPTDPNFEYVTLLLPGDGTNGAQNNTFLDSSTNAFTVTRNGNTTQGTFSPYGDNWSNFFDGTGDYLSIADNAALQLTNDFTIEFFIYAISTGAAQRIIVKGVSNANDYSIDLNTNFTFTLANSGVINTSTGTITANTWNHVALTRSGSNCTWWINGNSGGTFTTAQSFNNTNALWIGQSQPTGRNVNGYLSNVRIVKGTAVYTGAFTPPTAPLTAITNTSLLTCQSNRFIDNSTNNFTITRNGDVSVQRFSPFSPTNSYSASTIGGSGYFDGTGDYLTAPSGASISGSSAYTVECWLNRTQAARTTLVAWGAKSTNAALGLNVLTDGNVEVWWYANDIATTGVKVNDGAWHHIASTFDGTTRRIFVDGILRASDTPVGKNTSASTVSIGYESFSGGTSSPLLGYLSNVRILNTAVYTANFTPPTSPLTAISGTSLLLNFTNAGIIDNAMMNNAETVGNAQISTAQSKWGGGSMAFDGTDDRLVLPSSSIAAVSGALTIEAWIYVINFSAIRYIYSIGANLYVYLNTSGYLGVETPPAGGYRETTTAPFALNTWTHIAVTKDASNNYAIFVNGVSQTLTAVGSMSSSIAAAPTYVGGRNSASNTFNGYIDDLRITNGVARYTANFTPPTAAFPLS